MAADSSSVAFSGHRPHRLMWLGIGLLAMLISALLSLRLGVRLIGWADIGRALISFDPDTADHIVLWQIRLPRMVGALLCGGCLGVAGALMQALTRNPLADPGLLGVNAGAALGVVICTIALGLTDPAQFIWAALAGAAIAAALVFALGGNAPFWHRATDPRRSRRKRPFLCADPWVASRQPFLTRGCLLYTSPSPRD